MVSRKTWEDIPDNSRLDGAILVKVIDVTSVGKRKTHRLQVQDGNGTEFYLEVWAKHSVQVQWSEGQWYSLQNTRGTVWTRETGETKKKLSTTADFEAVALGEDADLSSINIPDQQTAETDDSPSKKRDILDEIAGDLNLDSLPTPDR